MQLSLTEGKISNLLVRFSLPLLLSSIIQMAYSMVDVIILGWFASPASLAGAGNGANLAMSIMSLFFGFSTGGMILLGQYYGAKQDDSSAKTVGNIIILQAATSIIGMLLILAVGRLFITITNVPTEIDEKGLTAAAEAWNYMRILSFGLIFQAGYNTISSILRALGNSKTPMVFIAISCSINILLDLLFIGPLGMGASGAALATIIAQAFSFGISVAYLLRKKLPFAFPLSSIRFVWATVKTILRLGIPISLQTVLNTISFIAIASIINNMGLYASSANGVVNTVVNLFMIIPFALGSALSAISAQNLGAGNPERALEATKIGVVFSLVIAIPATLAASFFPTAIVSLMSPHPDVVRASAEFLIPFSWDFLFVSFVFCLNGFFNGCGITTFVAVHELVAAFAVRIPVSWLLSLIPGATLFHVGIGTPAATLASLLMCLVYYKVKLSGDKLTRLKIAGDS